MSAKSFATTEASHPDPHSTKPANDSIAKNDSQLALVPQSHPFRPGVPNKLLTRKRKRSRHPLRELRLQRGYTLEELAELTKLSPSYLSRLESGTRRLNADILQRLAHILSCHPGDLLPTETHGGKFVMMANRTAYEGEGENFAPRYPTQDLPLYHLRKNTEGKDTLILDTASEWITRPPELMGVAGAISFSINDASFGARYRVGDKVFAHPTRPLTPNCSVLAVTYDNQAVLGEFMGWKSVDGETGEKLAIRKASATGQDNQQDLFSNDKVKAIYRVIGLMESA